MNFLKSAVYAMHDATKLSYVFDNAILKWFMSKFQENHHIPGPFHCEEAKDFRIILVLWGTLTFVMGHFIISVETSSE